MGRHVILRYQADGRTRERLRGIFTDAQFQSLPFVKQYGCFPQGYAAVHFGDSDTSNDPVRDSVMSKPETPEDARATLARLLQQAKARKYKVWRPKDLDGPVEVSSQTAAWRLMFKAAEEWRHQAGRHNWKYSAPRYSIHTDGGVHQPAFSFGFQLKLRGSTVHHVWVERQDIRYLALDAAAPELHTTVTAAAS